MHWRPRTPSHPGARLRYGYTARGAFVLIVITLVTLVAAPGIAFGEDAASGIAILPDEILLSGPEARQMLLVEQVEGENLTGQLSEGVEFSSSDPDVVVVQNGVALPTGDGAATITATIGPHKAAATVRVSGYGEPFTWSFRNHVESVLSKAGCNSGACHGAQAGKNGFRLSLRGYDPEGDFNYLTRESRGRRIVPSDPGRSLLLTKPTGAVPHGGGLRFDVDSLEYRVLAEWIAAGSPPPANDDPRLARLEIIPPAVVLDVGARQQFVVRAHFNDGHVEDVTRWAKFMATDVPVADVDEAGLVEVAGYGEGAITAWYLSQVIAATVTVPGAAEVPPEQFADAPRHNFIDELVLDKLERLNVPPSPPADDGAFLRRAYLDTIGVLPTSEEVRAFLADEDADKRERLIDALLERPEWVDYWSYKWSDLLLVNSEKLPPAAMWSYHRWIRNHVAANTPWDKMVRELMTASGSTLENGAANFFVLHQDPRELAENTSLAFLGTSIGCAKCHNHPLEKWTNDQYFAMANLFARVRMKDGPGSGNQIVFSAAEGDLVQPLTGNPQPPTPLDGESITHDVGDRRRAHLAEWLTSADNRLFSRAIVNRVWANFMGAGLVENVDDLRDTNPPSNEALFDALTDYLVEHEFDLKPLMRVILASATYQRSSEPLPENAEETRFYARYYPRRLMAEVLLDAYSQATGVPSEFPGYPAGWRALELPDSNVSSYFLQTFGRPERVITCECERVAEPTMVQVLHISNGDTLNSKLASKENRLQELLKSGMSNEELIDEAYLSTLARYPTEQEKAEILAVFAETNPFARGAVLEDLYWGILSSREFIFNH